MPTLSHSIPSSENIVRHTLDNGITVLVYENPAVQSVVLTGEFAGGAVYERADRRGLATMTAGAVMRGTQNRSFEALSDQLESIGADLEVEANRYSVGFDGKGLAEDLPVLVELLADVLRYPTFPEAQIERLRGETLTVLNYYQQDTSYLAGRGFVEALYPEGHPHHATTMGTLESVAAITLDDLHDYHRKLFGPKQMHLVIVGNIKAAEALEVVRGWFSDWSNPDQPSILPSPAAPVPTTPKRVHRHVAGKSQSDIVMGFAGPARHEADYIPAVLANSVLGEFGMMGRIGDVVREEKGLAYHSRSSIEGGHGPGAWAAYAGVSPDDVEEAVEAIVEEFRRIVEEPVTAEELEDVKLNYVGGLPLRLESNEGIAASIARMESYQLGLDYLLNYPEMIQACTLESLQQAAAHYINPAVVTVSVAGA
jgi:zinc protease